MENKQLIQQALGLTDFSYGELVYLHGMGWLRNYFLNDARMQVLIESSPKFWSWWKSQWAMRDNRFVFEAGLQHIAEPLTGHAMHVARELYHDIHRVDKLYILPHDSLKSEIRLLLRNEILKESNKIKTIKKS